MSHRYSVTAHSMQHEHCISRHSIATYPLDFTRLFLWPSHSSRDLPVVPLTLVWAQHNVTAFLAMPSPMFHVAKSFAMSLVWVQCNTAKSFTTSCQILRATKYHAAKFFTASHLIHGTYLIRAQSHAAKFTATPSTIAHATEFFTTPHLILGTSLHVLKLMAIESQKLFSTTSDVVHANVITTGEPTTPSLLITALPSLNDLFAGVSHAHNLLQAQPTTLQCILHESANLDDLPLQAQLVALQHTLHKPVELHKLDISNDNYGCAFQPTIPFPSMALCYELHIMPMRPHLTVVTRSLLANQYNPFFEVFMGNYAELFPERIIDRAYKQSCTLPVTQAVIKCNTSEESIAMDHKTFTRVSLIHSFGRHIPVGPSGIW